MRPRSRLLVEPTLKAALEFVLRNGATGGDVLTPALDALQDVEVVLNVLETRLLGQAREDLLSVLLGRGHHDQGTAGSRGSFLRVRRSRM